MARLYANENFPRQVVEELRKLKHEVLTTVEAGNAGKSMTDEDVLAFAIQNRRAVITLDRRDFITCLSVILSLGLRIIVAQVSFHSSSLTGRRILGPAHYDFGTD